MKGPSGVEYPIFHVTYPTSDGRWMVAGCKDGKIVMLPDFYQSEEDARLVSATLNERESERYRTEVIDTVQAKVRFDRGYHRQPGVPEPVMQIGHSKISNPAASQTLADSANTFARDAMPERLSGK
jgi:hypothetical protein